MFWSARAVLLLRRRRRWASGAAFIRRRPSGSGGAKLFFAFLCSRYREQCRWRGERSEREVYFCRQFLFLESFWGCVARFDGNSHRECSLLDVVREVLRPSNRLCRIGPTECSQGASAIDQEFEILCLLGLQKTRKRHRPDFIWRNQRRFVNVKFLWENFCRAYGDRGQFPFSSSLGKAFEFDVTAVRVVIWTPDRQIFTVETIAVLPSMGLRTINIKRRL